MSNELIYPGQVWLADITDLYGENGNLQTGARPWIVVANSACCRYSPVITMVPCSGHGNGKRKDMVTHVTVRTDEGREQTVFCEQITGVQKSRLLKILDRVSRQEMEKVYQGIRYQVGMEHWEAKGNGRDAQDG